MTIDQLQKPNVASTLISKFSLTPGAADRRGVQPVGLALTGVDDVLVSNAGDDSVMMYDVQGRLTRRIDQRQLLPTRREDDDNTDDDDGPRAAAAAADKTDSKLVSCTGSLVSSYTCII